MGVYRCIYTYIYIYTYTVTYPLMYVVIHLFLDSRLLHTWIYTCVLAYIHRYLHNVNIHTYLPTYVPKCMCVYIYIYTQGLQCSSFLVMTFLLRDLVYCSERNYMWALGYVYVRVCGWVAQKTSAILRPKADAPCALSSRIPLEFHGAAIVGVCKSPGILIQIPNSVALFTRTPAKGSHPMEQLCETSTCSSHFAGCYDGLVSVAMSSEVERCECRHGSEYQHYTPWLTWAMFETPDITPSSRVIRTLDNPFTLPLLKCFDDGSAGCSMRQSSVAWRGTRDDVTVLQLSRGLKNNFTCS